MHSKLLSLKWIHLFCVAVDARLSNWNMSCDNLQLLIPEKMRCLKINQGSFNIISNNDLESEYSSLPSKRYMYYGKARLLHYQLFFSIFL